MSRLLDLADIQGGILRDYGEHYPKGRFVFIQLRRASDDEGLDAKRKAHGQALSGGSRRRSPTRVRSRPRGHG